jgi:hypothetical protein
LESTVAGGYGGELLAGLVPGYYLPSQWHRRPRSRAPYTPKRTCDNLAIFGCCGRVVSGLGSASSRDRSDDRRRHKRAAYCSHIPNDARRATPVPLTNTSTNPPRPPVCPVQKSVTLATSDQDRWPGLAAPQCSQSHQRSPGRIHLCTTSEGRAGSGLRPERGDTRGTLPHSPRDSPPGFPPHLPPLLAHPRTRYASHNS